MSNPIAHPFRSALIPKPALDPDTGTRPAIIDLTHDDPPPQLCCPDRRVDRTKSATVRVNELPDVDLLALFEGGRAAPSFEAELFRRIRRYAAPELRAIVGATPDEDDLSQEVSTKVWVSLGRFDPSQASFRTWVSRIAGNTGRDYLRRSSARPQPAPGLGDVGCIQRAEWEGRVESRQGDPASEEAHILSIVVDAYCDSLQSRTEAQAVRAVLSEGYRISDVKAMQPSVAGRIDGWVKKARNALRAEVSAGAK